MKLIKKTITLPYKLVEEVEKKLVGTYFSSLSEAIKEGLRLLLEKYEKKDQIALLIELYEKGKISIRDAAKLLGLSLRETYEIFSKRGAFIQYGEEELIEDLEYASNK